MNRFSHTITAIAASTLGSLFLGQSVFAQTSSSYIDSSLQTTSGLPDVSPVDVALNVISTFLSVLGIITLVLIIYAGFMILISGGSEEKVKKGRETLMWAIIGAVVILSSLGITLFIENLIG